MAKNGGSSWIPMAVALVATAAFIGWLATREPPESVAVQEPGDTTSTTQTPAGGPAQTIEPDVLNQTAATRELIGQDVEIAMVRVSDVLGTEMFWIELPGGAPFLVKMDSAQLAAGRTVPSPGVDVRVVGRVLEKTPEVLDAWTASGALANPDQRMLAEFGSTFIEARRVEPAGS